MEGLALLKSLELDLWTKRRRDDLLVLLEELDGHIEQLNQASRGDIVLGRFYQRLARKKHHGVAKVAAARKLLVRLYWMLRTNTEYPGVVVRTQDSSNHPWPKSRLSV